MRVLLRSLIIASIACSAPADVIWDYTWTTSPPVATDFTEFKIAATQITLLLPLSDEAAGSFQPLITATGTSANMTSLERPALPYVRSADRFVIEGKFELALRDAEDGLRLTPDDSILLQRAAVCAALAKKYDLAERYFSRVIDNEPENLNFMAGWVGVLVRLYKLPEAAQLVARGLNLQSNHLMLRYYRRILVAAGAMDEQEQVEYWRSLPLESQAQLASWLAADHDDFLPLLSKSGFLAVCDDMLGKDSGQHLEEIRDALFEALTAQRTADRTVVAQQLERAINAGLDGIYSQMELAKYRFSQGLQDQAESSLGQLILLYPANPAVHYNLGYILLKTARYEQASQEFKRSLEEQPDQAQAEFALACAEAGQGNMDQAWNILKRLNRAGTPVVDWLQGDQPYLEALRKDHRYRAIIH